MSKTQLSLHNPLQNITRRQFVKASFGAILLCAAPWPAWAKQLLDNRSERFLSLYNTHTGEKLSKVVYWQRGSYLRESLRDIDYLLRDHRTDETMHIDAGALDVMFALREKFPVGKPFEIISGYRSPETNRTLRKTSSGAVSYTHLTLPTKRIV